MKKVLILLAMLLSLSTAQFSKSGIARSSLITEYFDTYKDISWQQEKAHLQNFAISLRHDSETIGCVAYRPAQKESADEIKRHTDRVRKYLTGALKIKSDNLFIVYLQSTGETYTNLQPIPKSESCHDIFKMGE